MEETDYKSLFLLQTISGIEIKNPKPKPQYVARDGRVFDNEILATIHDRDVARESFYQYLMSKRNSIQRFFNIKPNMDFYDEMTLKVIR